MAINVKIRKIWCKSRSGTRMDELSSLDQILLAGRKLNTWGGEIWRAGLSPELPLGAGLCSFCNGPGAENWGTNCGLSLRFAWALAHSAGSLLNWEGMEKFPSSPEKTLFLFSVPGLQQKVGLKIRVGQDCHSSRVVFVFQSLWQGCSLQKSINLNQIKLMCCHIYPVSLVVLHHVLAYKLHDRVIQGLPADTETNPHVKLPADVLFQLL